MVKKMITLEAPIEEVDFNFYQIGYDLNNPEELREIVKATKTSKPDIVIMSETKDVSTMNMIYEEAQLHHSVSTIHKADVK
jgi:type II secretory ATPase GspE/PulE/Tfp pilus assembly ATPase PilB-like protein